MTSAESLLEDLVARGVGDWVQASEVVGLVIDHLGPLTDEGIEAAALGLVALAVGRDLVVSGDLSGATFEAWNTSPAESLWRIVRSWAELGRLPHLGEVCWLMNTSLGDDLGQRVLGQAPGADGKGM